MIEGIIKQYEEWKACREEDDICDSIDDFFCNLSRSELMDIINYLIEYKDEK